MRVKIILCLLGLSLVLGLLYVFFTPPWQAPDEITHYEYVDILARAKLFKIKHQPDFLLQKHIIRSMDQFNAWKYVFREKPDPLPTKFWYLPLYGGSNPKINRPPLYYILGSFVLKISRTDNLLSKHYLIRLFSVFLSLLTILFVYLAARIVFDNDPYYSLTAACFVAFLPQFMIISGSINSDSLANLIGSIAIYAFLSALAHPKQYSFLLLLPFLIILGLLTGRTTFYIVPSFIIFAILYILKRRKKNKSIAFLSVLISVSVCLIAYLLLRFVFVDLGTKVATNILEILGHFNRVFQKDALAVVNRHTLESVFRSSWYYSGWMAFSFPDSIYHVLKIFSLIAILGLIKYVVIKILKKQQKFSVPLDQVLLLLSMCVFVFIGLMIRLMSFMSPMARYLFPALPAFVILFVVGLKELIPLKFKKITLTILIFLFIVLNVYAIFHHLINAFYYRFW